MEQQSDEPEVARCSVCKTSKALSRCVCVQNEKAIFDKFINWSHLNPSQRKPKNNVNQSILYYMEESGTP